MQSPAVLFAPQQIVMQNCNYNLCYCLLHVVPSIQRASELLQDLVMQECKCGMIDFEVNAFWPHHTLLLLLLSFVLLLRLGVLFLIWNFLDGVCSGLTSLSAFAGNAHIHGS